MKTPLALLLFAILFLFCPLFATSSDVSEDSSAVAAGCEVCIYVMRNKIDQQPYLCRGLKDKAFQDECVKVLKSMMWYLENVVYMVNFGCAKESDWVSPCDPHAMCGFFGPVDDPENTFCPPDPKFSKPE